jgi:hypothetical protein
VRAEAWNLESKFNGGYMGFKYGFFNVFGIGRAGFLRGWRRRELNRVKWQKSALVSAVLQAVFLPSGSFLRRFAFTRRFNSDPRLHK